MRYKNYYSQKVSNEIVERVKPLMKQMAKTEFANILGADRKRVYAIFNGEHPINVGDVQVICTNFGVTPNYLFGWEEENGLEE